MARAAPALETHRRRDRSWRGGRLARHFLRRWRRRVRRAVLHHLSTRQQRARTLTRGAVWLAVCWMVAFVGWFVIYLEPHRVVERLFLKSLAGELLKGSEQKNLMLENLGVGKEMSPQERAQLRERLKRQFGR